MFQIKKDVIECQHVPATSDPKEVTIILCQLRDFPGGPVIKNPLCNAGDKGLISAWKTKIPYATGQLSLHATSESMHSGSCVPYLESPCATVEDPT